MEIERRLTNDELKNQNRLADRISEQMQVDMYMSFSSFITKKGRNIFVDFPHEVLRTEFLVWKIWIQHRNCRMQEVLINSMLTNPQQSPATYHLPPITYHLPSTTCTYHLPLTTYHLPPATPHCYHRHQKGKSSTHLDSQFHIYILQSISFLSPLPPHQKLPPPTLRLFQYPFYVPQPNYQICTNILIRTRFLGKKKGPKRQVRRERSKLVDRYQSSNEKYREREKNDWLWLAEIN
eukprot:TRINITY_DN3811_c0_g2_i1.p1 TRINITY_DN3811_c0_g2~~TRINITY_DN3811_c0_g2_i1.p1  ORF type:complete len:236 (+),score=29.08 TRINITY_DN3811_c0_g2_i1:713-1420(+)